jgi:hypothetical protein
MRSWWFRWGRVLLVETIFFAGTFPRPSSVHMNWRSPSLHQKYPRHHNQQSRRRFFFHLRRACHTRTSPAWACPPNQLFVTDRKFVGRPITVFYPAHKRVTIDHLHCMHSTSSIYSSFAKTVSSPCVTVLKVCRERPFLWLMVWPS